MADLQDFTIAAHGGLDRWRALTSVSAHLENGGALWALKGQDGVIDDVDVRVELHHQFTSHSPFGAAGTRSAVTAERDAIETTSGGVIEERFSPRESFAGHTMTTPWDRLQLAYFAGYAMWTYVTAPFSFAMPGFRSEELEPWQEDGETWRRLKVTFPEHIATHCPEQTFYIDADGMIRRHDYTSEVVGPDAGWTAHYSSEHREIDGIVVPTRRRVLPLGPDNQALPEPVIVSIDLSDIRFA